MSWWDDAVHRAVAEVVLAGALAGLVGVQVVLRRLSFFTTALTHATFPGVVAATLIGVDVLAGGIVAGAVVALGVAALSRRPGQNASAATGVLLSAGFALGAGLVATRSGFSRDLSSLLVGSVLTVSTSDLIATATVVVAVTGVLVLCARPLAFVGFDPAGARAAGFRTGAWDVLLLLTVEVTVVTVVPAVGTILAIALIVAPAAAARQWTTGLRGMTAAAVVLAVTGGLAGLYASARWNVAAGAAITLSVTAILVLSSVARGAASAAGSFRTTSRCARRPPRGPGGSSLRTAPRVIASGGSSLRAAPRVIASGGPGRDGPGAGPGAARRAAGGSGRRNRYRR